MKIINRANSGVNFEPYCVEFLHLCLNDENTINKIKILLYNKEANVFNNPAEALYFISENSDIDIAFLDIEMPVMTGLELAIETVLELSAVKM